jgi:hypothetical protein
MNVGSLFWFYFAFYKIRYKGTCVLLKFVLPGCVKRVSAALVYTLCIGINYDNKWGLLMEDIFHFNYVYWVHKRSRVLVPKIIMGDTQELITLYFFCQRNNSQSSLTKVIYFCNSFLGNSDNTMVFCQLCWYSWSSEGLCYETVSVF